MEHSIPKKIERGHSVPNFYYVEEHSIYLGGALSLSSGVGISGCCPPVLFFFIMGGPSPGKSFFERGGGSMVSSHI